MKQEKTRKGGRVKMTGLTTKQRLAIANSGGQFQEVGLSSWVGTKIRKGKKEGIVISDMNGLVRTLTVRFKDSTQEKIVMNNVGPNPSPEELEKFEWLCKNYGGKEEEKWLKF